MWQTVRKPNEGVLIGATRIVVLNIKGNRVTLGIEAPGEDRIVFLKDPSKPKAQDEK